jgi:hypothetical protein
MDQHALNDASLDPQEGEEEGGRVSIPVPVHTYGALVQRTMSRLAEWTDAVPAAQKIMGKILLGIELFCTSTGTDPRDVEVTTDLTERGRIVTKVYRR